jgi:hypothetical protein
MSEQFQTRPFDARLADLTLPCAPLPFWLAQRLLRNGEKTTRVYGPKVNPSWERFVTHPGLFLIAVAVGAICVWFGSLIAAIGTPAAEQDHDVLALAAMIAGAIVLGSIFVVGFSCGYFTRLVVTNRRVFIVQGYEVCKSWDLDHLPPSLVHYSRAPDGEETREVDLGAVHNLLGSSSNQVADAKTILGFGKHLDHIKGRERGHF